ncbi:insoluble matrix shell protein [Acrasis kona]|uniref:Insoluble matrix shell protein n=1 Tax=Acrasis kona TaxID=1008807 RepID=A0AAW2ZMR5_9EUKA
MRLSILLSLLALCATVLSQKSLVVMDIFSGVPNPRWHLEGQERARFMTIASSLYKNNQFSCEQYSSGFGYKGFRVYDSEMKQCLYVVNAKDVESFLLEKYITLIKSENQVDKDSANFINQIKNVIAGGVHDLEPHASNNIFEDIIIDKPIKGPDNVTVYSPDKWNSDPDAMRLNNDYNYGADIRTDTFAQFGRRKGTYIAPNCAALYDAAIFDGLQPIGFPCPEGQPKLGHYFALLTLEGRDFAIFRKDLEGTWSGKKGTSPVSDLDDSKQKIICPDKADTGDYKMCGYFIAVPSKMNIQ